MCFLAFVVQRFVPDLRFPQVAHIHERHPPSIETEQKHIAGFVQFAVLEIPARKGSQQASGYGQFRGSGRFERYLPEGVTVCRSIAAPPGSIIKGVQGAQIE